MTNIVGKLKISIALLAITGFGSQVYAEDLNFSLDKYYSPYMGANWIISAERGYEILDDTLLSGTVDDCSVSMSLARMAKWGLELTLFSWGMVTQNELFGHGARAREFHASSISYQVFPFRGRTLYSSEYLQPNAKAAIAAGGMEATTILAQQLEREWVRYTAVDSRAATLYLANIMNQSTLVFGTSGNTLRADNDVNTYIANVNAWQGGNRLTNNKLKSIMIWDWVNPMIYISALGIGRYMWVGEQTTDFDTWHWGNAIFMPTTRVLLAPYGPEYQLLNNFYTPEEKFVGVNFRFGSTGGVRSYGADLLIEPINAVSCWTFTNKLSIWYQPHLLKNYTAAENSNKYGFADFVTAKFNLSKNVEAFGELGYKVSGFMPGVQLTRGAIWRIGFTFNLDNGPKRPLPQQF